jgi:branched-chain amino acid aminotransferase
VPTVTERVAYVNGRMVPESAATVSIYDRGFLSGHGVFERTRTFRGELFRLDEHLARLIRSMRVVHLEPDLGADALKELTLDLVQRNRGLLGPNDDYSVGHFVTRGVAGRGPTVVVFCEPIDFRSFARQYLTGAHVVSASTRALPINVLDPKLKTTSRLHFWLAEEEAHLVDPEAYPLLLDLDGNVCELNAANFWIIRNGTIVTPPDYSILVGITRMVILELAEQLGVPLQQVDFQLYDVVNADEAFLTTTSRTILPVTRANGRPIGTGQPGPLVKRLQQAWIKRFDFDFVAQALAHLEE